jgi:polygalacturonase
MSERKYISGKFLHIKRTLMTGLLFFMALYARSNPLVFNILDYRAKGDGVTINTKSIQAAIDACSKSGGGTVWFPAGRYVSGTIYLKSHITLHLEAGAVLEGSRNLKDYPVTISKVRSYTDNYTDKSLIYAEDLENISITGKGLIEGNGDWFKVENMDNNEELRKKDDFAFYKYRPFLIRMINCRNILVRDITLLNSPMWVQHYLLCEDVNIDGIKVNSRVNHNNDGIDIDGCQRVRISNSDIISGDDAIVLKSTLDKPCKNVTVTNCTISSNCNAFKLGTETNGGFQNITFSNSVIYDTHLAGITLQLVDGGTLERVSVSNVTMNNVGDAIFIRLGNRARSYMDKTEKSGVGKLSHVIIDNIQGTNIGKTGCSITGLPGYMVEDIVLSNICLSFEGGGTEELAKHEVPELPVAYPEHDMYGDLPAYGFYCRHCRNIRFNNIELGYEKPEARHAMIFDDVENLELKSLAAGTAGTASVIALTGVKNALIQSCVAYEGTGTYLELYGALSDHIALMGNDLSRAKKSVQSENHSSVFIEGNHTPSDAGISGGRYVNCDIKYTDDREIRIKTPAEVKSKRLEIIRAIWGAGQIPDRSDVVLTPNVTNPLNTDSFALRVDRFEIPVNAPVAEGTVPVRDLAYFFVPVKRNNRLILLNPGHSCTLKDNPETNNRIEATITGLLKDGFDVLAVFMPHVSDTSCNLDHCGIINSDLGPGDHPAAWGLRFFLEPEIVSLNYLLLKNNYLDINMVGLSGGGWTTNLIAAIDERIKYSFSVAGSMPLYYRSGESMGDIEQFMPELYRDVAGYPDLYVLGAYGTGRKQVQILNRNDDCCFGQKQHDRERNYDKDLKTFEGSVKAKLKALEADGHYYLVIDETAPCHQISGYALTNVILKELIKK